MRLLIKGKHRELIDIKTFRAERRLSADFGVATFEPKDYTGLGSIEGAGAALNTLKQGVLEAIPTGLTLKQWMTFVPDLSQRFRDQLNAINPQVGLRDVEVDFAVAGFTDLCQTMLYARMSARSYGGGRGFEEIHTEWLNNSVRVSKQVHTYTHEGRLWAVQIVNHIYGRVGLMIRIGETTHYVRDSSLACPAEKFIEGLAREVAEQLLNTPEK